MSRLVGDLILLAKSGRPDFLAPQPVSLERLTHTLLAKARGLADRDWRLDEAGEAIVAMDEQRITQAVLAAGRQRRQAHATPATRSRSGRRTTADRVRLWVRDTGAGVPAEDRERIFERFGRSDVRAERRGVRARAVHRAGDRRGARRYGHRRGRRADRRAVRDHAAAGAAGPTEATDGEDEDAWPGS